MIYASELIEAVYLQERFLQILRPTEPLNRALLRRLQEADHTTLSGGKSPRKPAIFELIRGGALYGIDALAEGHAVFQEAPGVLAAYWHGMIHRREGDFDNARYWFRRAGNLPIFEKMHQPAREFSADMARQPRWDPGLFTGQCERARFGEEEHLGELRALQRVEFDALLDYCWRESGVE